MLLSDILASKKFDYLELLNPCADLKKEVLTVESTETPDAQNYIAEKAILLTTAMYFKKNQDELINFIERLIQNKSTVALIIKTSRFLGTLDSKVIDYCKSINFPIFILSKEKNLGEVYQDILATIWNYSQDNLKFVLNTQKTFSDLLLKKTNTAKILDMIQSILKVELAIIDPFGNIEKSSKNFQNLFPKEKIRSCISSIKKLNQIYINTSIKNISGFDENILIRKMDISTYYPYYIFVVKNFDMDLEFAQFIIEQVVFSLAFSLYSQLTSNYHNLVLEEKIFDELLKYSKENNEQEFFKCLQLKKSKNLSFGLNVILYIPKFSKMFPIHLHQECYVLIYNWMKRKIKKYKDYNIIPLCSINSFLIQSEIDTLDKIISDLNKILKVIKDNLNIDFNIAIGSKYNTYKYFYQSYNDAINAIENGQKYFNYNNISIAKTQSYQELFSFLPESQKNSFINSILKDLANDNENYRELRDTLKVWLFNQCNIVKTASTLFIHRNTVNYRIDKCRDILNSELIDALELFNLEIALALLDEKSE